MKFRILYILGKISYALKILVIKFIEFVVEIKPKQTTVIKEVIMYELKLYVNKRLKDRIKMLATEKGLSMNKMANQLLEIAIYKLLEEEKDYGKIESK